jgi:hypothetical protein
MYAATEMHSILTISKWERRHARPFLTVPRAADPQNPEPGAAVRAPTSQAAPTSPQIFSRLDID